MIIEDYVSFETAKLLKEKGFNGKCNKCYAYFVDDDIRCLDLKYPKLAQSLIANRHPCITLQMAMKWLREVHNIHIDICSIWDTTHWLYQVFVITPRTARNSYVDKILYTSYEQAVEAGIKYSLKNLI